jgi:tetratricopeptide (TPR) repeat protein
MTVLFPPDYVVLVNSGLLAAQKGDTAKSVEFFEAALRLAPHESKLHLYLGQTLETGGNYPAASREYAHYITLHQDDFSKPENLTDYLRAALKLADLSQRQNRPKDAVELYHRIEILAREHGRTEELELAESNLRSLGAAP